MGQRLYYKIVYAEWGKDINIKQCMHSRVGRFWNFTFVHIGEGYWSNIKHCETWKGFRNLKTTGAREFLNAPPPPQPGGEHGGTPAAPTAR